MRKLTALTVAFSLSVAGPSYAGPPHAPAAHPAAHAAAAHAVAGHSTSAGANKAEVKSKAREAAATTVPEGSLQVAKTTQEAFMQGTLNPTGDAAEEARADVAAARDQVSEAGDAEVVTGGSYVAGLAFTVGAVMKFKQHKDNPTQVPIGTPITLVALAAALLFLPSVLSLEGYTVVGTAEATDVPGVTISTE